MNRAPVTAGAGYELSQLTGAGPMPATQVRRTQTAVGANFCIMVWPPTAISGVIYGVS